MESLVPMAVLAALEAQGARCGHIDGKAACGNYTLGMEAMESREAAELNTIERGWIAGDCVKAWQRGYEAGFRVGADGEALDAETVNHALPEEA